MEGGRLGTAVQSSPACFVEDNEAASCILTMRVRPEWERRGETRGTS
jgi:hypothetical protein